MVSNLNGATAAIIVLVFLLYLNAVVGSWRLTDY